jgi:hypothetical protein
MSLPRDLAEAGKSVSNFQQADPNGYAQMLGSLDLDVLLGNRARPRESAIDTPESPPIKEKPVMKAAASMPSLPIRKASGSISDEGEKNTGVGKDDGAGDKDTKDGSDVKDDDSFGIPLLPKHDYFKGVTLGSAKFGGGPQGRGLPMDGATGMVTSSTPMDDPPNEKTVTKKALASHQDIEVAQRLLGLPGRLSLTVHDCEKYFGEQAKVNFFDR